MSQQFPPESENQMYNVCGEGKKSETNMSAWLCYFSPEIVYSLIYKHFLFSVSFAERMEKKKRKLKIHAIPWNTALLVASAAASLTADTRYPIESPFVRY